MNFFVIKFILEKKKRITQLDLSLFITSFKEILIIWANIINFITHLDLNLMIFKNNFSLFQTKFSFFLEIIYFSSYYF